MKKLFKKRIRAAAIDALIFAVCFELFRSYIVRFATITDGWGYFLIFSPLACRDILFKNASIGKKIVGLVVVDENFSTPSFLTVLKRSAFTGAFGQALYFVLKGRTESKELAQLAFVEFEQRHLKASVVEKKKLKSAGCDTEDGSAS